MIENDTMSCKINSPHFAALKHISILSTKFYSDIVTEQKDPGRLQFIYFFVNEVQNKNIYI